MTSIKNPSHILCLEQNMAPIRRDCITLIISLIMLIFNVLLEFFAFLRRTLFSHTFGGAKMLLSTKFFEPKNEALVPLLLIAKVIFHILKFSAINEPFLRRTLFSHTFGGAKSVQTKNISFKKNRSTYWYSYFFIKILPLLLFHL